jgi:hypothetical protein
MRITPKARRRGEILDKTVTLFCVTVLLAVLGWMLMNAGKVPEPTQAERDAYAEEQLKELGLDSAEFIRR